MSKNNEIRKVKIIAEGKTAEASIKQLRAASKLLNDELSKLPRNSQAFKDKMQEFHQVNSQLRNTTQEIRQLDSAAKKFWSNFKTMAGAVVGGNLLTGLLTKIQEIGKRALKMKLEVEEALIDVKKVTGLTDSEMKKLQKSLGQINTRTSRKELLDLAWSAGKLGTEGVDDITGFVKAANQIKVALGKDLGQDAIQQVGKMVSIFKLEEQFGIEKGMLKIASAINDIGMASTASEGFLVNFAKRMSGLSGVANLQAPDIIALAGTLDSLGQTAETSSTALSKLFVKMGGDVETFAKFAKMDVEEFSVLLKENAVGALKAVLQGVGSTADGIENLAATLGDLGLDGGRIVGVLGSLASNTQELTRQQEIANKAFKDGVSVTNEYNLKNQSAQASVQRLYKWINKTLTDNFITRGFTNLLINMSKFVEKTDEAVVSLQSEKTALFKMQLELNKSNLTYEQRQEIIKKLKDLYPEYLKNIDTDKVTNEELAVVIDKVNRSLIAQIAIRKLQVKAEEQATDASELLLKREEQETKVEDLMVKMLEKHKEINSASLKGNTTLEQAIDLHKKILDLRKKQGKLGAGRLVDPVTEFGHQVVRLDAINKMFETAERQYEKMGEDIDKMHDKLLKKNDDFNKKMHGPEQVKSFRFDNQFDTPTTGNVDKIDSLAKQIRDIKTKLIEDVRDRERQALKDSLDDEIKNVKESTAIASEKNTAIKLLNEKYRVDLKAMNEKFSKEGNEKEFSEKIELLKDFEMTEKIYLAKMVQEGKMSKKGEADELVKLEIELLEERKKLAIAYGKDVQEIELALAKAKTETLKDIDEKRKLDALAEQQYRIGIEQEGSRKRLEQELIYLDLSKQAELESLETTEEQKALIEDFYRAEKLRKEKEHSRQVVDLVMHALQEIGLMYSSFNQIKSNKEQAEFDRFKNQQTNEVKLIEESYENKRISKEEYERKKEMLDAELREKERKIKTEAFKRQQRADMIQAAINTALAITRAKAAPPGPPLNTPVVIATGVAGALQIAAIKSKPVPQFFAGGSTQVTGAQDGKRYKAKNIGSFENGGVYTGPSVGLVGEKGAELVVPNHIYTDPGMANVMNALESLIVSKQFFSGGVTTPTTPPTVTQTTDPEIKQLLKANMAMMQALNKRLNQPLIAKTIWNQDEFERFQDYDEMAKSKSAL